MNAPKNLRKYLDGKLPLPAGFVPLLSGTSVAICITPSGWMIWNKWSKVVAEAPKQAQRMAMDEAVRLLGGTSAKAAAAIGVSPRTVESWRCGRKRLTVERAYEIARAMAEA
jgi:hypothetical protein